VNNLSDWVLGHQETLAALVASISHVMNKDDKDQDTSHGASGLCSNGKSDEL
jgi:hypothetical protein